MNWKLKAIVPKLIDMLPSSLAYPLYYRIQSDLGSFRSLDYGKCLKESSRIIKAIQRHGRITEGQTFLEVGTGWGLSVPIGLWLSGASRIITVDINPYLKEEVVRKQITGICGCRSEIQKIFGEFLNASHVDKKLDVLMSIADNDLEDILETMNIEYLAPADAASIDKIQDSTVDIHFSTAVLEHIPPSTIRLIFWEAKRVLTENGLLVHRIDLFDHFSSYDKSISSVNFLKFTDKQWDKWAGNRFMYHNRLRAYDFYELFDEVGLEVISREETIDSKAVELLRNGSSLADRFVGHRPEQLAVKRLNIVGMFTKYKSDKRRPWGDYKS